MEWSPAPPPLFDSHAHLVHERLADDLPDVLARAAAAGVAEVLIPATGPEDAASARDAAESVALAESDAAAEAAAESDAAAESEAAESRAAPRLLWSAGLHPHEARRWDGDTATAVAALLAEGAAAVGETGLDFHYDNAPRHRQREAFAAQAALARARGLALIVHSREADADTAAVLRESRIAPEHVILHCFSAGEELLREALERGYHVSFSGLITFAKYGTPHYLSAVPAERLLVETDAPYLAPVPFRGQRNEPAFLPATVARLAAARGIEPAEAAAFTRANARRVYGLPEVV